MSLLHIATNTTLFFEQQGKTISFEEITISLRSYCRGVMQVDE